MSSLRSIKYENYRFKSPSILNIMFMIRDSKVATDQVYTYAVKY